MKPLYNIIYIDNQGNKVFGRRLKETRKIELESGRLVSHSWATKNLDYVGLRRSEHDQRNKCETITTPNGFKIRRYFKI